MSELTTIRWNEWHCLGQHFWIDCPGIYSLQWSLLVLHNVWNRMQLCRRSPCLTSGAALTLKKESIKQSRCSNCKFNLDVSEEATLKISIYCWKFMMAFRIWRVQRAQCMRDCSRRSGSFALPQTRCLLWKERLGQFPFLQQEESLQQQSGK